MPSLRLMTAQREKKIRELTPTLRSYCSETKYENKKATRKKDLHTYMCGEDGFLDCPLAVAHDCPRIPIVCRTEVLLARLSHPVAEAPPVYPLLPPQFPDFLLPCGAIFEMIPNLPALAVPPAPVRVESSQFPFRKVAHNPRWVCNHVVLPHRYHMYRPYLEHSGSHDLRWAVRHLG